MIQNGESTSRARVCESRAHPVFNQSSGGFICTQGNSQSNFQLMVKGPGMLKLVIRNVTAEHQGNYTCHAQNILGKTLETIQLIGAYVGCQYEYVSNSSTLLTN